MDSAASGADAADAVFATTTLERLMPRFGEGLSAIAVKNESGNVVGQVTPQAVLSALANEHDEEAI
jgi:CBS-domain-containing membrane protein